MITEEAIKKEFIQAVMTRDIRRIYDIQEQTVRTYLHTQSGALQAHLARKPFSSTVEGDRQVYYMRVFPYLRFLDIHYRRGGDRISRHIRRHLALYNRVVWGVLYHETFPDIQYGLSEDIRRYIRQQLEQALPVDEEEVRLMVDY